MIMKSIEGYEGLYSVTPDGRVWSHTKRYGNGNPMIKGRWLKPSLTMKGYPFVNLSKNNKSISRAIHRLVGETFISNPENKPQINHKNSIKTDNRIENLEWATNRENWDHGLKNGMFDKRNLRGENSGKAKLTWEQVNEIRENHHKMKYGDKPHKKYNISRSQYDGILNNKMWKIKIK